MEIMVRTLLGKQDKKLIETLKSLKSFIVISPQEKMKIWEKIKISIEKVGNQKRINL